MVAEIGKAHYVSLNTQNFETMVDFECVISILGVQVSSIQFIADYPSG